MAGPPTSALKKLRSILWAVVIIAGGFYLWTSYGPAARRSPIGATEGRVSLGEAPSFALTDQEGSEFSSQVLSGKVWLASFIYTRCQDECPRVTAQLRRIADRLQEEALLGAQVEIVSISVDPAYDTPKRLKEYAERFHVETPAWHFLTGDPDTVFPLLNDGFHVTAMQVQQTSLLPFFGGVAEAHMPSGTRYDILHTERIAIIDTHGEIRGYPVILETSVEDMVARIKALL